jgi:hypothetical protein
MASSETRFAAPKLYNAAEIKQLTVYFETTDAAEDYDLRLLYALVKPIEIVDAKIMFHRLDTFSSGVDIDLETDTGSAEAEIANYDTVGGASATAVATDYSFTFTGARRVALGSWLQARINHDEDADCAGSITVFYVEVDA